ncbi:PTS sugar transporter subunit IIB [Paludifilum halophilum]|uniref:PTS sugar transporter subunit IIB n=1 Tax=Paludifilum halophilum TaxID=1642702 RepID=A0A235B3A9_9BACL|nr:PTS sugar transporter subunit IIB [Paludifilum halophilum]OYD06796.1 PTS sugar transporter subunit IIB [Paludifilum halophilum]
MKVLMVCSGGMSSAIVVKAIKEAAEKEGFDLEIKAVGTTEFENELPGHDMGLVAPQVKHQYETLKGIGDRLNIPVELIPPMGYTPIGAPKVLEQIKKTRA